MSMSPTLTTLTTLTTPAMTQMGMILGPQSLPALVERQLY